MVTIGIILIASALFLIVAVLLQSGKDKGLSGTVAGSSSDTYYGKNKGSSMDRFLSKATTVIAVIFVVLVFVSFIIQDDTDLKVNFDNATTTEATTTDDGTAEGTTEGTAEGSGTAEGTTEGTEEAGTSATVTSADADTSAAN
ncbi:MAG: preprotein translocase subunit SecG [Clostridia bacterium]|nr:preprotein translocase subunit SecG [Clostridia bacterium]